VGQGVGVGGGPKGSLPGLNLLGPIYEKKVGSNKTQSRLCSTSKHSTSCDWSQVLQRSPQVTDRWVLQLDVADWVSAFGRFQLWRPSKRSNGR
jgi:hypothetical protein